MTDLQQDTATRIARWLAAREGEMVTLLEALVNADSSTYDKAGVDACGQVLERFWADHGLAVERRPVERYGDVIYGHLRAPEARDPRPVLLLGHRDTVFPQGEPERRPFSLREGRGYGPGVADMKSGLVVEAFALAAFAAVGGIGAPVTMMTTSDEEIASPGCGAIITEAAKAARFVLNAEPSRVDDEAAAGNRRTQIVTRGRKGGVFLRAEAIGRAAHSGAHYDRGRSAILDLAQKVAPLHALTDLAAGVSVNVGLIGGGQTVNTIAPNAWFEIDLRYVEPPQRDMMIAAIRAIVETPMVEDVVTRLTISGEFLPLVQTPQALHLFETYRQTAARLGIEVSSEFTGGCADSGLTAAAGCPTLCSVGPTGGGGHTPQEYVEIDSLVPTAQTIALSILALVSERATG